jgi:hypothetical protein
MVGLVFGGFTIYGVEELFGELYVSHVSRFRLSLFETTEGVGEGEGSQCVC